MTRHRYEYDPSFDPSLGRREDYGGNSDRSTRSNFSDEAWGPRSYQHERPHHDVHHRGHHHHHHQTHQNTQRYADTSTGYGSYYPAGGQNEYYSSRTRNQDLRYAVRPATYETDDYGSPRQYEFAHTRDYYAGLSRRDTGANRDYRNQVQLANYGESSLTGSRFGISDIGLRVSSVAHANVGRALWLHHASATQNGNLACADSVSQILTHSGAANVHELTVVGLHRSLRNQGWRPDSFANRRPGDVIIASGSGGHLHAGIVGDNPNLTFENNSWTGKWTASSSSKWQGRPTLLVLHAPNSRPREFDNA